MCSGKRRATHRAACWAPCWARPAKPARDDLEGVHCRPERRGATRSGRGALAPFPKSPGSPAASFTRTSRSAWPRSCRPCFGAVGVQLEALILRPGGEVLLPPPQSSAASARASQGRRSGEPRHRRGSRPTRPAQSCRRGGASAAPGSPGADVSTALRTPAARRGPKPQPSLARGRRAVALVARA